MKRAVLGLLLVVLAPACNGVRTHLLAHEPDTLRGSTRREQGGWIFVHVEGAPERIGFQHGWHLADEIEALVGAMKQAVQPESGRPWSFYRESAQRIFWPRVPDELRAEIQGIARGAREHGARIDEWDIVAANAFLEIAWYYIPKIRQESPAVSVRNKAPGMCSAFVATGSFTAGGRVVIAHNSWVGYWLGRRWNVILDVAPTSGHRFIMDALPGYVHSGDDFYLSDAGLMVTETTIAEFHGFDPLAVPEFVRARRAIQFSDSIDQWIATMSRDSNGAYANDWLIGDRRSGEIAQLENGLRNQPVWRKKDGYFVGANFASDPRLIAQETSYRARAASSMEARRRRWEELMTQHKGKIDVDAAKRFLADHHDVVTGKDEPGTHTLCGHGDLDPEPRPEWDELAFAPGGAISSKVSDSDLAARLELWAAIGHACGIRFSSAQFLAAHPQFAWQKPFLGDVPAGPWTLFSALGL
jgi:Phospholipase B